MVGKTAHVWRQGCAGNFHSFPQFFSEPETAVFEKK
jgi:hypothetical protein